MLLMTVNIKELVTAQLKAQAGHFAALRRDDYESFLAWELDPVLRFSSLPLDFLLHITFAVRFLPANFPSFHNHKSVIYSMFSFDACCFGGNFSSFRNPLSTGAV